MLRRVLATLVFFGLLAPPCVAKSKTAAAVAAANSAKADFHARNAPSPATPEGVGVAHRTLKVRIAAVLADGRLALESSRGEPLGTLDPLSIPELVAQDKRRFDGRKRLDADDLETGQRLKLTFRGKTSEILRAKVLKER